KLNLLFGKRINVLASQCDNADGRTLPHEWDAEQSSKTTKSYRIHHFVFRVCLDVMHVDLSPFEQNTPSHRTRLRHDWVSAHVVVEFRRETKACNITVAITFRTMNACKIGFAKPRRRFNQRVEHCLEVEGRTADYLQHVGGGGLLLQ